MIEQELLERAGRFLRDGDHYLLTTHIRPDGDALGSMVAMARWLRRTGKRTTCLLLSPPADRYACCLAGEPVLVLPESGIPTDCYQADRMIVLDTAALPQLEGLEPLIENPIGPVMVIDHHVSGDGIGQVRLVDHEAAAAGIIVAELIEHVGGTLDRELADPLFVAVATDTGWFRFSNTDARTCRWAAAMLECGVEPDVLYRDIHQTCRPSRLRLLGELLSQMELHADDRIAVLAVTRDMFQRHSAAATDTENLIDAPQEIGSVIVAILLTELPDNRVRVSLRSKHTIDVNRVASTFGGGGHVRAAGTYFNGTLAQAKAAVVQELAAALEQAATESPSRG